MEEERHRYIHSPSTFFPKSILPLWVLIDLSMNHRTEDHLLIGIFPPPPNSYQNYKRSLYRNIEKIVGCGKKKMWDTIDPSLELGSICFTKNVKWLRWHAVYKVKRGLLCQDTRDTRHEADCQGHSFQETVTTGASGSMISSLWKIELAPVTRFSSSAAADQIVPRHKSCTEILCGGSEKQQSSCRDIQKDDQDKTKKSDQPLCLKLSHKSRKHEFSSQVGKIGLFSPQHLEDSQPSLSHKLILSPENSFKDT